MEPDETARYRAAVRVAEEEPDEVALAKLVPEPPPERARVGADLLGREPSHVAVHRQPVVDEGGKVGEARTT